jgi:hypothetical protein
MKVVFNGTAAGLALTGLLLAGCSSSTGADEAVQDDAVVSASATAVPSAQSMAASEGPSRQATSPASASPLASDGLEATMPESTSSASCQAGLAYSCGDIGPGGGTVFYAVAQPFACGPITRTAGPPSSTCNFLESAPNPWNPDSEHACPGSPCGGASQTTSDFSFSGKGISWCTGLGRNEYVTNTYDGIGYGYANTAYMNTMCGDGSASQAASGYQGGGLTDWYLPSKDELNMLYAYPNRASIGGFNSGKYWTSSGGYPQGRTWFQSFDGGQQDQVEAKGTAYGVRPIRAF